MKISGKEQLLIDLFCKFRICSNCHQFNSTFTCNRCKRFRYPTFYCNPTCQKNNWLLHKPKCLEQKRATKYNNIVTLFFSMINIDLLYLIIDGFTAKDLGNLAATCSKMRDLLRVIFTLKPKPKRILEGAQVLLSSDYVNLLSSNAADFKALYPSILSHSFGIGY